MKLLVFLSLLLPAVLLPAGLSATPTTIGQLAGDQDSQSSAQETRFRRDLNYLARELPRQHKNLFAKLEKVEFERQVAKLDSHLQELDLRTFQFELSKLIAAVGDGHTQLVINVADMHYFPFNARWYDDQITVIAAGPRYSHILGAAIEKINGVPIETILKKLRPFYSVDNDYGFRNRIDNSLNHADLLAHAYGFKDYQTANFQFRKDGQTFTVTLEAIAQPEAQSIQWQYATRKFPLYSQKSNLNFWNDWLPEQKTLYFKYNRCQDADGFKKLVNGTSGFVKQNDVQRFVVDLRDNGGGNSAIFKPLEVYLAQQKEFRKPGHLFVIIGRGTFSSGLFAAYDLKRLGAVVVGEPTGGKPNHFGEIKSLTLPESRLNVFYSTRYWTLLENENPASLVPDLKVRFTASDALLGIDPALQAIWDYSL